ncbi:MAG: hypothetical protein H6830_04220 [Planctomycetes bacterium]|nr:hypothetical protein [Planctomycetota bacterium]MCB9910444.1 hypothetical protein [Planctomycetota bacterium]MCB9912570.1 hypothetical protein [Planctomycetota bacterium]
MELKGTPKAGDLLSWALPVLLHRLANQTQWITGLRSVLSLGGGDEWLQSKGPDLTQAGQNLQDAGWLLAVLGSGQGANLLLARREPRGLTLMVGLLEEGLRKETGQALPRPERLPYLSAHALDGWQLPYALGHLVWQSYGVDRAQDGWTLVGPSEAGWVLDLPWSGAPDACAWLGDVLPGCPWTQVQSGRLQVTLPSAWLEAQPE